ncbi:hypothetical protein FI667_g13509, partial [Globisporangium splendens]
MHAEGDLSEQFTFQLAMKRPSDQVNREERPSSKRQRTAPELFDISPILKKKGDLEFYKERFFSWRRINDRDDPNQHIAAQRDSWRTFVRLENENKMERLLRRGNARAQRRTPADDRANPALVVVVSPLATLQAVLIAADHVGNIRLQCLTRLPRVRARWISTPPNSVEALMVQLLLSSTMSRSIFMINNRLNHPAMLSLRV